MLENLTLATNDELKEEARRLLNEFEDEKTVIARAFAKMMSCKQRFDEISEILRKREGDAQ